MIFFNSSDNATKPDRVFKSSKLKNELIEALQDQLNEFYLKDNKQLCINIMRLGKTKVRQLINLK